MTTTTDYQRKGNLWLFNQMYGFTSFPIDQDFQCVDKAILICAKGDGTLAPAERDWELGYSSALGSPESVLKEMEVYEANDELAQVLANASEPIQNLVQRDVVYHAIKASAADGELSEAEQKKISQMAELLGVTSEVVEQLVELHKEEKQLRQKRIKLLYPNGTPY
jgi:hypothetical protein